MSVPQDILDQFNYDKGFYDGAKAVLDLQIRCQPLTSIQEFVSRIDIKFKQLEHLITQAKLIEKPKEVKKKVVKPKKVKK